MRDTPRDRIGRVLLLLGLAVLIFGAVTDPGRGHESWWEAIWGGRYARRYPHYFWGTWIAIAGALLSLAYPYTLGPALRWIRYGSAPKPD